MEVTLERDERIEDLQCKGLKIIQNKSLYTFTSDSVILANFIKLKRNDKCVEIGCGSGIISILLSAKTNFDQIYAFEFQKEMADLAEKNVGLNNLREKIQIINDSVQNFNKHIEKASVDVVFSNPPYMQSNVSGNINSVRDKARHDTFLPIDVLCRTTTQMLRFGGKFYFVYTANRTAELIYTLLQNDLQPKRMFFTENGKGKVILVVIEGIKGGKFGIEILPNLITNDVDGKYIKMLQTKYVK